MHGGDQEDPLEEGMATHSSILAWRIPWPDGETDTQCTILLRSEAGNSSELLNEEKHLKWGREKLRLDPPPTF